VTAKVGLSFGRGRRRRTVHLRPPGLFTSSAHRGVVGAFKARAFCLNGGTSHRA
jgi:hypothetical protein